MARSARLREMGLGFGLLILAAGVVFEATQVTVGFSYDNVGPRAFPYLIAVGLAVSGLVILNAGRAHSAPVPDAPAHDGVSITAISAALLLQMVLIGPLGWIPVATVSFAVVAWAFGSRRIGLNLTYGLVLAAGTFVLFNYGLGLQLPVGRVVEWMLPVAADG